MFTQQKTHTKHPTWPHLHTYTTHHEVVFTVWTCVRTIIIIIMILELILHTGLSLCFPYKQIRFSILSHFLYAGWYVTWQYGVFFPFLKAQFLCNLWLMEPRLCVCVCVFSIFRTMPLSTLHWSAQSLWRTGEKQGGSVPPGAHLVPISTTHTRAHTHSCCCKSLFLGGSLLLQFHTDTHTPLCYH